MNSTTGSEYTENIYIHLKLIFAFAAQSSLSKCVTITYETLFARAGRAPCPHGTAAAVPHTQTSSGTRYSCTVTTVPCHKTSTNHDIIVYYVQLHIDDAILCIINDVMIVLY